MVKNYLFIQSSLQFPEFLYHNLINSTKPLTKSNIICDSALLQIGSKVINTRVHYIPIYFSTYTLKELNHSSSNTQLKFLCRILWLIVHCSFPLGTTVTCSSICILSCHVIQEPLSTCTVHHITPSMALPQAAHSAFSPNLDHQDNFLDDQLNQDSE
jgi:hypothetical protein